MRLNHVLSDRHGSIPALLASCLVLPGFCNHCSFRVPQSFGERQEACSRVVAVRTFVQDGQNHRGIRRLKRARLYWNSADVGVNGERHHRITPENSDNLPRDLLRRQQKCDGASRDSVQSFADVPVGAGHELKMQHHGEREAWFAVGLLVPDNCNVRKNQVPLSIQQGSKR